MKEVKLLFSNEVRLEDDRIMKLDYSLTENRMETDENVPYYGVRITKHLDDLTESDEVCGISTSKDTVVSILKKLCRYEVTPISMVNILDDMVTIGID